MAHQPESDLLELYEVDKIDDTYISQLNEINKKNDFIDRILSYKNYEMNWDGKGAYPLDELTVSNSISFINNLNELTISKIDVLVPTPNGTLNIMWLKDNERLSFEIGSNNFSYYALLNNKNPVYFDGFKLDQNIANDINEIVAKINE